MQTLRFALSAAAVGLLLYGAVGCGSRAAPLLPVRGRVTFRGVPLHTGSIVYSPHAERGTTGPLARADIQPDGTYVLRTGDKMGAVAGWHRITILAVETPPPLSAGEAFAIPRLLLPARYGDPELSGLSREVVAGRENRFDFNLE
jgi:hypothetical protein